MSPLRKSRVNPNRIESRVKSIQVKLQKHRVDFLNRKIDKETLLNRGLEDLEKHYLKILDDQNTFNKNRKLPMQFTKYGSLFPDLQNGLQWWREIVQDLHVR